MFPSAKIIGGAAPGYSSGEALEAHGGGRREGAARGYTLAWTGAVVPGEGERRRFSTVFLLGVLMVFLMLAAQYERWTLPFAVILAVPFAVFGAFLAVFLRGLENDIYFQIGMVTLVGLAAKNAILIVEFAQMKVQRRHAAGGGGGRRRAAALPADHHDVAGVHLRRAAAGDQLRRRRGQPAFARHGRDRRHAAATFIATFFVPLFFGWIVARSARASAPPGAAARRRSSPAAIGAARGPGRA